LATEESTFRSEEILQSLRLAQDDKVERKNFSYFAQFSLATLSQTNIRVPLLACPAVQHRGSGTAGQASSGTQPKN